MCSLATNWAAKDVPRATGLKLLLTNSHPTRLTRDMAPRPPWHSSVVPVRRQLGRVAPCTPCILCERLCSCHNFLDHCIVCVACDKGQRSWSNGKWRGSFWSCTEIINTVLLGTVMQHCLGSQSVHAMFSDSMLSLARASQRRLGILTQYVGVLSSRDPSAMWCNVLSTSN